jgi:hypothetical protein
VREATAPQFGGAPGGVEALPDPGHRFMLNPVTPELGGPSGFPIPERHEARLRVAQAAFQSRPCGVIAKPVSGSSEQAPAGGLLLHVPPAMFDCKRNGARADPFSGVSIVTTVRKRPCIRLRTDEYVELAVGFAKLRAAKPPIL